MTNYCSPLMAASIIFCSISFTSLDSHLVKISQYMILQYSFPWQISISFHIQLMFVYLLSWFNVISAFLVFCEVICKVVSNLSMNISTTAVLMTITFEDFHLYTVNNLEDILLIQFHLFISIITTKKRK